MARLALVALALCLIASGVRAAFDGEYFSGEGDDDYLFLLNTARRQFSPDPELQSTPMLYNPAGNSMVEGPTWNAWWTQNSYGPTLSSLPFVEEPMTTFLQNSQDFWFDHIGDGNTKDPHGDAGPDGCLCDDGGPSYCRYKQGDGLVDIHDWTLEESISAVIMQAELLLISADTTAAAHYLPLFTRTVRLLESRRDVVSGLFLSGPASNLLAPSYGGMLLPNGTRTYGHLAGLTVSYSAALERISEVADLLGEGSEAARFRGYLKLNQKSLPALLEPQGQYFVKSIDTDGTKHGVLGAARHGYLEASVNHDAVALEVVDDGMAQTIMRTLTGTAGLRPHTFVIANYPGLDDMEEPDTSQLWSFGFWVNGGAWSTCEARMILAYYRCGYHEDARRSMRTMLDRFAVNFRMDNPLTNFGHDVYQPTEPINLTIDNFGVPGAFIRGLFSPLYLHDRVVLRPRLPPSIRAITQKFPIRYGPYRLFITMSRAAESGPSGVVGTRINGTQWAHTATDIPVRMAELPPCDHAPCPLSVEVTLQTPPEASPRGDRGGSTSHTEQPRFADVDDVCALGTINRTIAGWHDHASRFVSVAAADEPGGIHRYPVAHAQLFVRAAETVSVRCEMIRSGAIRPLPSHESQIAADKSYIETASRLYSGLEAVVAGYKASPDPRLRRLYQHWVDSQAQATAPRRVRTALARRSAVLI